MFELGLDRIWGGRPHLASTCTGGVAPPTILRLTLTLTLALPLTLTVTLAVDLTLHPIHAICKRHGRREYCVTGADRSQLEAVVRRAVAFLT